MKRYRFTLFGRPAGPWRDTKTAAQQDAIEAGEAFREEWGGATYLSPGVEIVEAEG